MRIGIIIIHLVSKLWKAEFFILCDVIDEAAGKFEEWKGYLVLSGHTQFSNRKQYEAIRGTQAQHHR